MRIHGSRTELAGLTGQTAVTRPAHFPRFVDMILMVPRITSEPRPFVFVFGLFMEVADSEKHQH